ncbi:LOW QUALITY PROTEIN: putative chorismate mutase, partial [Streptomyces himastatinicus ATCC 53653]
MTHRETDPADRPGQPAPTSTTHEADDAVRAELVRLRESIDNIDAAVVHMLAERFKCTQQVGHLKAAHKLPPADPAPRGPPDHPAARTGGKRQTRSPLSPRSCSTSSSPRSSGITRRSRAP